MNSAIPNRIKDFFPLKDDTKSSTHFDNLRLIKHIIDNTRGLEPYKTQVPKGYYAIFINPFDFEQVTEPAKEPTYSTEIFYEGTSSKLRIKEGTSMTDEIQKDVAIIKNDIGYQRKDINELKDDVKNIVTEKLPGIQVDIAILKSKVTDIDNKLGSIFSWFKGLTITIIGSIIAGLILYYFKFF